MNGISGRSAQRARSMADTVSRDGTKQAARGVFMRAL